MSRLYEPASHGYAGDEDNGQTSAWYGFSALGFYPVCPVTGEFAIGCPLFEKMEITMPSDEVLVIEAQENDSDNVFIEKVERNGVPYNKNFFRFEDIREGGIIEFQMSDDPNRNRNVSNDSFPFSYLNSINK